MSEGNLPYLQSSFVPVVPLLLAFLTSWLNFCNMFNYNCDYISVQ
jgi:hypothetical protein